MKKHNEYMEIEKNGFIKSVYVLNKIQRENVLVLFNEAIDGEFAILEKDNKIALRDRIDLLKNVYLDQYKDKFDIQLPCDEMEINNKHKLLSKQIFKDFEAEMKKYVDERYVDKIKKQLSALRLIIKNETAHVVQQNKELSKNQCQIVFNVLTSTIKNSLKHYDSEKALQKDFTSSFKKTFNRECIGPSYMEYESKLRDMKHHQMSILRKRIRKLEKKYCQWFNYLATLIITLSAIVAVSIAVNKDSDEREDLQNFHGFLGSIIMLTSFGWFIFVMVNGIAWNIGMSKYVMIFI